MRHVFQVRVGPVGFRIGSDWPEPIAALRHLYAAYPPPADGIADHTVRLFAPRPWRRIFRPQVMIGGDYMVPGTLPLPLRHGLLAAEMGMNLQMALGQRRYLLLHAATVERDGEAAVLTGVSGAGKSTFAVLLAARGWRFMGDEFALVDPATGLLHPFPRPASLKNAAIPAVENAVPAMRWGPLLQETPKGTVRHVAPDVAAIDAMDRPARPRVILFPRFGAAPAVRPVPVSEAFVRSTQASTNYVAMGEAAFDALTTFVRTVPAYAIDYPDAETGIDMLERLWGDAA